MFACGRYEGIDERVVEDAAERFDIRLVSLGDYVLNGGEVAVLAIVEAVARLLPGVVGNAESLVEESHEDGLLEYPVYTRPATWRGRDVPGRPHVGPPPARRALAAGRSGCAGRRGGVRTWSRRSTSRCSTSGTSLSSPTRAGPSSGRSARTTRADFWPDTPLWQTERSCRRPAAPCHRGVSGR